MAWAFGYASEINYLFVVLKETIAYNNTHYRIINVQLYQWTSTKIIKEIVLVAITALDGNEF